MYYIIPVWFWLCENKVTLFQCEESWPQRLGTTQSWRLGLVPPAWLLGPSASLELAASPSLQETGKL